MLKVFCLILLSFGSRRGDRAQPRKFGSTETIRTRYCFSPTPCPLKKGCWHNLRLMLTLGFLWMVAPLQCQPPTPSVACRPWWIYHRTVFVSGFLTNIWQWSLAPQSSKSTQTIGVLLDGKGSPPNPHPRVWKEIFAGLQCFSETRIRLFIAYN